MLLQIKKIEKEYDILESKYKSTFKSYMNDLEHMLSKQFIIENNVNIKNKETKFTFDKNATIDKCVQSCDNDPECKYMLFSEDDYNRCLLYTKEAGGLINKKNDAIFILSNIDQFGVYKWIGSNYETIKTKDGLIVETKGLRSDIKFYSYDISILEKTSSFDSQVDLYNPDLIFANITLRRNTKTTYKNSQGNEMNVFQYTRIVPEIGWKAKESYTFKNGVIYQSMQQINPMLDPLEINFYFKY